jgi:hypothetical protein
MKKIIYLFVFVVYSGSGFAQNSFKLVTSIETKADFITTDAQSNVYVVKGNELSKYNKTGKLLYKYSNKNLGNIDFVDVSNMLKPFLFYKNFLQIIYLDNTLSTNGDPVALDLAGYNQAQLACSSFNSSIWLYDQQNLELVRLDQNLEKLTGTGNLSVLLNMQLQPNYLLEYDNKVFMNNPSTGILIFDIYGTYFKTISIPNILHFQVFGEWVYFMTADNKIEAYHIKTAEIKQFTIPDNSFVNFRLEDDILFLQDKNAIELYTKEQ